MSGSKSAAYREILSHPGAIQSGGRDLGDASEPLANEAKGVLNQVVQRRARNEQGPNAIAGAASHAVALRNLGRPFNRVRAGLLPGGTR